MGGIPFLFFWIVANRFVVSSRHDATPLRQRIRKPPSIITDAVASGGWAIFMIHGVGQGTHGMFMDVDEHDKLVNYLAKRQDSIWTAPVVDVAKYLKSSDPDFDN